MENKLTNDEEFRRICEQIHQERMLEKKLKIAEKKALEAIVQGRIDQK